MRGIFKGATAFNKPIGDWDVSQVTNMQGMFEATTFNQPINTRQVYREDNSSYMAWNVSNITNIQNIFYNCPIIEDNKPTFPNWDV